MVTYDEGYVGDHVPLLAGVLVLLQHLHPARPGLSLHLRHHLLDVVVLHRGDGGSGRGAGRHLQWRGFRQRGCAVFDGLLFGMGVGGALSTVLGIVLCQSFDFQFLGDGKEVVEVLLRHVDLPVVHEVKDGLEIIVLDALQVEERVLVRILLDHRPEEGRAACGPGPGEGRSSASRRTDPCRRGCLGRRC